MFPILILSLPKWEENKKFDKLKIFDGIEIIAYINAEYNFL